MLPSVGLADDREWLLTNRPVRLGEERLMELRARGAAMAPDEAVAYAHSRNDLIETNEPPSHDAPLI